LTGQDENRRAVAMEVLRLSGAPLLSLILHEALAPRKKPQHRVQLLRAVEESGHALEPGDYFSLVAASRRPEPEVQEQIGRVLAAHRRAV
jgi:hypothetical protein